MKGFVFRGFASTAGADPERIINIQYLSSDRTAAESKRFKCVDEMNLRFSFSGNR